MNYISLVFDEDIDTNDLSVFKRAPGCIGVSAYKNTLNLYFKSLSRNTLFSLALVLHQHLERKCAGLLLTASTLDSSATTTSIYEALREEAAI